MSIKKPIFITCDRYVYLILIDSVSGRKNRYTTYQIAKYGLQSARVIGRSLLLKHSRKLVVRFFANGHKTPNFIKQPLY